MALCAASMIVPATAVGQTDPTGDWPIPAGSKVRILSPVLGDRPATGSVVSATPEALLFRAASESTVTTIATPNIVGIDIARGTHTSAGRAGFAGFILGALVGAVVGTAATPPPCTNCLDFSQGYAALGGGLAGGVIGALVGVAIGKRPTDTWVPVAIPGR